jgi:FkbM family methyltransferase
MRFSAKHRLALLGIARGWRLPDYSLNWYQELTHLRVLLRQLSINCVLDVGANTGQFAGELRAAGFDGLICSFEPVERAFLELQARFRGDPMWRGYRMALGSENSQMTMHVDPALTIMSSLLKPRRRWPGAIEETVEVRRLDDLFDEAVAPISEPRIFLKMDTQGYDLQVFEGAAGCVGRIQGLQSELSVTPVYEGMPTYLEALSTYQGAGFSLFNLSVVTREPTGDLVELNCFMKRATPGDGSA